MPRLRQFALAASLAAFAVGCAHCDTCDDFPAPCTGPNCGYPYHATFPFEGGTHMEPIVTGPGGEIVHGPIHGSMAPGTIMSTPPNGAPAVVPPAPTPAEAPSGGPSTPSTDATSPPDSPPASPNGADPFNIPLPPADSPFSNPSSE